MKSEDHERERRRQADARPVPLDLAREIHGPVGAGARSADDEDLDRGVAADPDHGEQDVEGEGHL